MMADCNPFKGQLFNNLAWGRNEKQKTVYIYLLDLEGGYLTKKIAKQFEDLFSNDFVFTTVTSLAECNEAYPIALLLRRQTDRAEEDIAAMMTKILHEDKFDRIALIYVHVVTDKSDLPQISTKDKVTKFKNLGIILDFGYERNKDRGGIYSCNFEGNVKSKQAFETFVMKAWTNVLHNQTITKAVADNGL